MNARRLSMENIEKLRVVFMGTPVFATAPLQQLIDSGYHIVAVVSQPDRPVGRKKELKPTPVKAVALQHGINVIQPNKLSEQPEVLLNYQPDLIVTCAYGQKVPTSILDYPKYGCVNLHGSLLPKYRGGAPMQRAIINGDKQTGMTLMEMIDRMDAGKMYQSKVVDITIDDTLDSLSVKMMEASKYLIKEALPLYLDGKLPGIEQDEALSCLSLTIKKEEERVSFKEEKCWNLYNHMRGLISNPAPYALLSNGKKVKFYNIGYEECNHNIAYGCIILEKGHYKVAANGGYIHVYECQMEGKAKMNAASFINGINQQLPNLSFE